MVGFALRQRVLIVILLALVLGGGVVELQAAEHRGLSGPGAAAGRHHHPEPGQSAEEIERYITIPIEVQMAGIPNVQAIRTISLFGLSDVKVQFTYDFTYRPGGAVGDQPPVAAAGAAQRRAAADLADQPDRRDLPLPRRRAAGLLGDRPEDHRGLGAASGASRPCPASSTSPAGAARPRPTRSRSTSERLVDYGLTIPQVLQALTTPTSTSAARPSTSGRRRPWCAASA